MPNNSILLICYSFPPHPGIGGRRWAKFSKILTSMGYNMIVANAQNIYNQTSFWEKDIDIQKVKLVPYKFQFQKILKNPISFTHKILRKLILFFLNKSRYTPHIITSLPNSSIWENIKKIIVENKIKQVIVSGDPFLFYYASLLKKEINFELILDYRDLWNDHAYYGKNVHLTAKQKKYFEYAENYAVNNCDKILFVDEYLESVIKKRIITKSIATHIIKNGFDKDDYQISANNNTTSENIKLFFGGSPSSDVNDLLFDFVLAFKNLSKNNPLLYNKFSISIYGEIDEVLYQKIKQLELSQLHIQNKMLSPNNYYEQLNNSRAGLVVISKEYANSFLTKFTDYVLYDKFTIALGFAGDFSNYLKDKNIGTLFNKVDSINFFENLFEKLQHYQSIPLDVQNDFDLNNITKKLINSVLQNEATIF